MRPAVAVPLAGQAPCQLAPDAALAVRTFDGRPVDVRGRRSGRFRHGVEPRVDPHPGVGPPERVGVGQPFPHCRFEVGHSVMTPVEVAPQRRYGSVIVYESANVEGGQIAVRLEAMTVILMLATGPGQSVVSWVV